MLEINEVYIVFQNKILKRCLSKEIIKNKQSVLENLNKNF